MADQYTSDPASIIAESQAQGVPSSSLPAITGGGNEIQDAAQNVWARSRGKGPVTQSSITDEIAKAHHEAVSDASSFAQIAEHNLTQYHTSRMMADTGGFLNEAHGLDVTDPQYEQKVMELHAKYPMNRVTGEQMRPLNEGRSLFLKANSELAQQRQEQYDAKHIEDALSKGHLTPNDLARDPNTGVPGNPSLWDQRPDGSSQFNVMKARMLAASRASGQAPGGPPQNLTPEELLVFKQYPDGKSAKKLLSVSSPDPLTAVHQNLLKSALQKLGGAGAHPATAAGVTPANPFLPPP
jgi:hypothetical protein